ncbi:2341_t:CDS:2 [Dentiscutata heterogama]|uniref:2341_t:CDS:1 n=1 Tax=Dentiscutata heterogama TaxID=1316150 RepID=A0ACA9LKD4_9GLOM|nr:2341_t:CDS:2 [Dentiscutata heterogama]
MKVVSPHNKNGVPIVLPIAEEGIDDESIDDVEETSPFDPNDELAVKELQQQINILHVCNPMPIEDLLNLEEEQEEQLNILRSALRIVDERIDDGRETMKSLCKL